MVAVVIVVVVVAIIIASFLTTVVMAALGVIGVSSPLGILSVGISVCYLYLLAHGRRPLAVELSTELLMLEPLGECGDSLTITDVGDGSPGL